MITQDCFHKASKICFGNGGRRSKMEILTKEKCDMKWLLKKWHFPGCFLKKKCVGSWLDTLLRICFKKKFPSRMEMIFCFCTVDFAEWAKAGLNGKTTNA